MNTILFLSFHDKFTVNQQYYLKQHILSYSMKTILISPLSIKSSDIKSQKKRHRTRTIANNIKNIHISDINKLQDLLGNKRLRQTSHIFYIKLNQQNPTQMRFKSANKSTLATLKQQPNKELLNIPSQSSPNKKNQQRNKKIKSILENSEDQLMMKNQELTKENYREIINKNKPKTLPKLNDYQVHQKTQYLYKKQSLNTDIKLLGSYNRYKQGINPELLTIQKTFYNRKPVSNERRNHSIRMIPKTEALVGLQTNGREITSYMETISVDQSNNPRENMQKNDRDMKQQQYWKKVREEQFTPWKVMMDYQDHQNREDIYSISCQQ